MGKWRLNFLSQPCFEKIGGKSGKKAALKLVKPVLSDRKSEVKSPSVEKLGKIKDDQVMRRSPRFSGSESEIIVGIEVKLGKKTPLKLIKSAECKESEGELGTESPSLVSPENLKKMEEDRVLRRSPRGLPSLYLNGGYMINTQHPTSVFLL